MDYKEFVEHPDFSSPAKVGEWVETAATVIVKLLDRAEKAEAANSQLNGTVTTLMESNRKLAEELKAHTETDLAKAHEGLSAEWAEQKQRAEAAEARAEKAEREKDALLKEFAGECGVCLHYEECSKNHYSCCDGADWEWRGQKEE